MLLLCIKDLYVNNFHRKIFTKGKTYMAFAGRYRDQLNAQELIAFEQIEKDYSLISEILEWKVIVAVNDNQEKWFIHMFNKEHEFDESNPFQNENFSQISTFYSKLLK